METKKTTLTVSEFIYSEIITISDDQTNRHVIIDAFNKTIECSAPGKLYPVITLGVNKSNVLQYNKKSISTCNIEMLTYALKEDINTFNAVYGFIKYRELLPDIKTFNKDNHITKSAFYNSFNDDLTAWVEFFKSCSSETRQQILFDHICFNHEAKMQGVISMSTLVSKNKYCQARCKNCKAICSHCYAVSLSNQRKNLKNKLARLHAILTTAVLSKSDIPAIDSALYPYFRFESFGDINNTIQINNYNLIAAVNPAVNFTLWTKNPGIVQKAINDGMQLSNNLVIGLSSLYLNTPEIDKARRYSFIRFLFTVYTPDYIQAHNVVINCGAKHCISCGICYDYLHKFNKPGDVYIINEKLK